MAREKAVRTRIPAAAGGNKMATRTRRTAQRKQAGRSAVSESLASGQMAGTVDTHYLKRGPSWLWLVWQAWRTSGGLGEACASSVGGRAKWRSGFRWSGASLGLDRSKQRFLHVRPGARVATGAIEL